MIRYYTLVNQKVKAVLTVNSEKNNGIFFELLYANMERYMNILNTYFSLKLPAKKKNKSDKAWKMITSYLFHRLGDERSSLPAKILTSINTINTSAT